jgi:RNA polymerase sigma-70 factor, ECF subfamily
MLEAPPSVQTPDEILVKRARERDPAAREELFERYRSDAFRVAYRLLGHEQDALDVVQESLIKALTALEEFDGRSGFRFWFLRIVGNTALDWGRRRKRRPTLTIGDSGTSTREPACNDDPASGLYQEDLRQMLEAGLNQLSPKIRSTFVLFAELQLSYKEISETQKIPIGTVMSRINSAREKLQKTLDWEKLRGLG